MTHQTHHRHQRPQKFIPKMAEMHQVAQLS